MRRLLPLSYEELQHLYSSNAIITCGEEAELECDLPNPESYPSPDKFSELIEAAEKADAAIRNACDEQHCRFSKDSNGCPVIAGELNIVISAASRDGLAGLRELLNHFILISN